MEDQAKKNTIDTPMELPQLTDLSASYILTAAKWGKFLAILGFIITGLIVVASVAMSIVLNSLQTEMIPINLPFAPIVFSVLYIIFAAIYVIPVIFLNTFCNNAIKAVQQSNTENLTISFRNLKNLFVFIGIATIILLCLYTITILTIGTAALSSIY